MPPRDIIASALASRIDFSVPGFEVLVDLYAETASTELLKNPTLPESAIHSLLGVGTRRIPLNTDAQRHLLDSQCLDDAAREHVIRRMRLREPEVAAVFATTQQLSLAELDAVLDRFVDRLDVAGLSYLWSETGDRLIASLHIDTIVERFYRHSTYARSGDPTFSARRYAQCVDEALALSGPGQLENVVAWILECPTAFVNDEATARLFVDRRPDLVERCAHAPSAVLRRAVAASRHVADPALQRQLLGLAPGTVFDNDVVCVLFRSPLCRPELVDEVTRVRVVDARLHDLLRLRAREIRNGVLTPVEGPYESLDAAGVRVVITWLRSRTKQGCSYTRDDPRLLAVIDGLLGNPRVDAKDRRYLRAARSRLPVRGWHVTETNAIKPRSRTARPCSRAVAAREWRVACGIDPLDPAPRALSSLATTHLCDLTTNTAASGFGSNEIALDDVIRALGPRVNHHQLLLSLAGDTTLGYRELVELVMILAESPHEETPTP